MAEEYYNIPEPPQYKGAAIRKLQDSDPASATHTFNPMMGDVVETLAYLQAKKASLGDDGKIPSSQLPEMDASIITYGEEMLDDVLDGIGQDISGLETAQAATDSKASQALSGVQQINQAIEDAGKNEIKITFEAAFAGKPFTVTDGDDTVTGTVPESLVAVVTVKNNNRVYTVSAQADNGNVYATSVEIGPYYGQTSVNVVVFDAVANVTAAPGAVVTAKNQENNAQYTATAGADGIASLAIHQAGTYVCSAVKDGASSNSAQLAVVQEGTYTLTLSLEYVFGTKGGVEILQAAEIVPEGDRSWCSSSPENDNRAVTIECASDTFHPYAINANVWNTLIDLCADICERYGIKELKWMGDRGLIGQVNLQNMTVHRWFANKSCPGDYIYERLGQIAKEVNQKPTGTSSEPFKAYQGQVNADDGLNCRTAPYTGAVLKTYPDGTVLTITKEQGSWGYTGEGWVCLDYINKIASAKDPAAKEEIIMEGKRFKKLFDEMRQQWRDNDASGYSEEARKWAVDSGLIQGGITFEATKNTNLGG